MISLVFAALGGGVATALVIAPLSVLSAVLAAPFGASLCTLLAAFYIARQRGPAWQESVDLDEQTDAMVAALRGLAAQAERAPERNAGQTEDGGRTRAA